MKFLTYVALFTLQITLCWNKERYNPINDFLLHEAGAPAPYNKNSNAQFPTLKPPSSPPIQSSQITFTPSPKSTPPHNKRDFVASQFPTLKPITSLSTGYVTTKPSISTQPAPKRDYVAPQNPTSRSSTLTTNANLGTTPKVSTYPQRNYVAPGFTTPKTIQVSQPPGKVKDLINFYDNKNNQGGTNLPKAPSYSSILKGPTVNSQTGTSSPLNGQNSPTKPTFSSTVSGSKNKNPANTNDMKGKPNDSNGLKQPGSHLPSSIITNNINNQGTNSPSDSELQSLSEELLKKDVNNAAKLVTINYQEKTTSQTSDDKAPQPLLIISPEVWNIPTIQKFVPLLDNYERDTLINEHVTPQERNEENTFMDAIMSTTVIRHLMNFLKDKGYVTQDPRQQRDFLKQIWFGLYSRGKGKISSSGFEHTFVSELKNQQISGLHNWIYFSKEEAANRVNYLGYLKHISLADKGAVLKMHFNQQGIDKPVSGIFIGTSPELEIALYTLCYVTRVEKDCNLKLGGNDVSIVTYNFRYRSKNYIGTAYPQI